MRYGYFFGIVAPLTFSGFAFVYVLSGSTFVTVDERSVSVAKELIDTPQVVEKNTQYSSSATSVFFNKKGYPETMHIAHALGSVSGVRQTNSKEALVESYKKGFRIFEADMSETKDGEIAIFHHKALDHIGMSRGINEVSLDYFLSHKSFGKFTLLSLDELLGFMVEYEDLYLVTDIKSDLFSGIQKILQSKIVANHPEILDRIIPQIYEPQELSQVLALHPFADIIFTLYKTPITNEEVVDFVANHPEITAVTMSVNIRYTEKIYKALKDLGVVIFVHTVNDPKKMQMFTQKGVGVYTDNTDNIK